MPNLLKMLGIAALGLLLVGCATPPAPIAHETAVRIHRVAVVSLTAKVFTRQYTGVTVFGNEKEELDISGWNIDAQYESQLAAELAKLPGITVVKVPYPEAEFSHVNDLNGPWDAPAFWGPNWVAIEGATRNYCAAHSLDGVIVLAKTKTGDFLAGTNQFFGGAGIYVRGPGSRVSVMHLISKIALLDCTTAKPIAVRTLANNQSDLPGAIVRSAPMLALPEDISRRPISQWSEQQRQQLQSDLATLPASAWGVTLRSMFPAVSR